jgi:hypothetical protein
MSLTDFTAADLREPKPGLFYAGRIEANLLGPPFQVGRLAVVHVLAPTDLIVPGMIYILVDGEAGEDVVPEAAVSIVRIQGWTPDLWVVDQFSERAPCQRCSLFRRRWQPRASIDIKA